MTATPHYSNPEAIDILNRCRLQLPVFVRATRKERKAINILHRAAIYLAMGKRAPREMRLHI